MQHWQKVSFNLSFKTVKSFSKPAKTKVQTDIREEKGLFPSPTFIIYNINTQTCRQLYIKR